MKAKWRRILVPFALVGLVAITILWKEAREPDYHGKPLSIWLQDWDTGMTTLPPGLGRTDLVAEVQSALRQMGAKAVPCLRKMLRLRDSWLRQKIVSFCFKPPLNRIRFRPSAYALHVRAIFAIRTLDSFGKPAIPELRALLGSGNARIRMLAAGALGQLDESTVVPAMIAELKHNDPTSRYQAAMVLGWKGATARSAIPELTKALHDSDTRLQEAATWALARIDPKSSQVSAIPLPPTSGTARGSSGAVELRGPAPASMALAVYKAMGGFELLMRFDGPVIGQIDVGSTGSLSQKEAMDLLEKALLDQCGIVLEHMDEKHVAVKMRHQK